jgi:hypothetical protein
VKLLSCLAIWRDPIGLLLDSRLRTAPLHRPDGVLHLLDNDLLLLMIGARHQHLLLSNNAAPIPYIIYCVRGTEYLIPLTRLSPGFLHHHLLAV